MFQNTPGEERLSPDFHGAGKEKRGRAGGDILSEGIHAEEPSGGLPRLARNIRKSAHGSGIPGASGLSPGSGETCHGSDKRRRFPEASA
jgi:hypothetical protein